VYDEEKGTATPITFSAKAYYTVDLESIVFSKYGFMILNGTTRYYYNVEADGTVMIYHKDDDAATKNEYGFVEEDFGKFEEVKEYGGKTYYVTNGSSLVFKRDEDNAALYPVRTTNTAGEYVYLPLEELTFNPSGSSTFSVSGSVKFNGESYTCYVIRTADDDGVISTYLRLYTSVGYYQFDINVEYNGDVASSNGNFYEITNMEYVVSLYSYTYLYYYYIYYSYFGYTLSNSFGMIAMTTEYGDDGLATKSYFTGAFGASSGMYDYNGKLISVKEAEYTYYSNAGIYLVEFVGEDGFTYHLYYTVSYFSYMSMYGYQLYACTRVETLTTTDGYTVTVERIIASDSYTAGTYWSFALAKDGVDIEYDQVVMLGSNIYYVLREKDEEGKITSTKYYKLILVEETIDIEDQNDGNSIAKFISATITLESRTTLYTADGKSFVDIADDNTISLMSLTVTTDGKDSTNLYAVSNTEYDEESKTYTITLSSGTKYTVEKEDDGTVTITEVVEAEEESQEENA
jgi:WD40 repeat protein